MKIKLQNKWIGDGQPTFFIAEVSANHRQNIKEAIAIIKQAKEAGADAVKFQAYTPDTMTINVDNKYFRIKHKKWGGQTLYQLYNKAQTPWHWFKDLKKACDDFGVIFFSTAFDQTSVDLLEVLNVPIHKIASFELVDIPLIKHAAQTKKPLIISTGMSSLKEIQEAVAIAKSAGAKNIILLKCVSSYPSRPEDMNLATIPDMAKRFKCIIGLSDHTLGVEVSFAAAVLGAKVIEKHIIASRKIETPDNFFSMEPHEFKNLVKQVRTAEKSIGYVHYGLTSEEHKMKVFRRSLFVIKDINKGERLTEDHVRSIRPSNGLAPKHLSSVIGKRVKQNLRRGTPLLAQHI